MAGLKKILLVDDEEDLREALAGTSPMVSAAG